MNVFTRSYEQVVNVHRFTSTRSALMPILSGQRQSHWTLVATFAHNLWILFHVTDKYLAGIEGTRIPQCRTMKTFTMEMKDGYGRR